MKDFYKTTIAPYAEQINEYFDSPDFYRLFSELNGEYLVQNYYNEFLLSLKGGKCIRAYLVNLFYRIALNSNSKKGLTLNENGATLQDLLIASAAFEVFEAAVLMHDDIIDRSDTRRSISSCHIRLGGGHVGLSRAICLGDAGILTATAMLDGLKFSPEALKKVQSFLKKIFLTTISGELADVDLSTQKNPSLSDILQMYTQKTAHYTMIGPCVTGAILAQASDDFLSDLSQAASNLGIAFQIKDDLMGIFSRQQTTGKSSLSDISEGKKTILTAYFDKLATNEQKKQFYSFYGKADVTEQQADLLRHMLELCGAKEQAEQKMNKLFILSKNIFDGIIANSKEKQELWDFCQYLNNRIK